MNLTRLERGEGGIANLLLCDPAGRNALDEARRRSFAADLSDALADPAVRAIVIGAETGNFCVGGDLSHMDAHTGGQASHRMMQAVNEVARQVGESPKPLVAAVTGHCIGAGAGLALLCDTIVLGRSAKIGFPFLKIGLLPDFGVSYTLPRRIGPSAARQALMRARTFTAEAAVKAGLVDEIVEDADVWTAAGAIAGELAAAPALALAQLRSLLRRPADDLPAALEIEALNQAHCLGSADMREGVAAFREKRPADFLRTLTE